MASTFCGVMHPSGWADKLHIKPTAQLFTATNFYVPLVTIHLSLFNKT